MVVTGFASGMVECRWYDGYGVKREAFREDELIRGGEGSRIAPDLYQRPAFVGRFHNSDYLQTGSVDDVCFFNRAARKRWIADMGGKIASDFPSPGYVVNLVFYRLLLLHAADMA